MHLEDLVLQDRRVVVQVAFEDRPFGDFDKLGRDLDAAPSRHFGIFAGSRRPSGIRAQETHNTHVRRQMPFSMAFRFMCMSLLPLIEILA